MNERKLSRAEVEALPCRETFAFKLERAGLTAEGEYRVRGVLNTFGVTHSRRLLHPRGFAAWLERTGGRARLPMLANHGYLEGFATIGEWDAFELVEGRGMIWSGRVGRGTPLTDQARTLLDQNLLRQLSVGWVARQKRYVSLKDADLDPHIRRAMEAAEVEEVLAFFDWYPVEGSIVDVGDDPGARLAADLRGELSAAVNPLVERVAALEQAVAGEQAGTEPLLEEVARFVRGLFERAFEEWKTTALEAVEAMVQDPEAAYAQALLDGEADASSAAGCGHGHSAAAEPSSAGAAASVDAAREQLEALAGRREA